MRFLYIDSQGKEVPIPTVDALALRIELGAITEVTRFYDANADRWAPAGEHEIFRSLTRELADKSGGFVAPPPVAHAPVAPAPAPAPPAAPAEAPRAVAPPAPPPVAPSPPVRSRAPNPFEALEGPAEAAAPVEPEKPAPKAAAPKAPADDVLGDLDFGLTLETSPPVEIPGPASERSDSDPFGVELTPMMPADLPPEEPPAKKKDERSAFDFGGFGGLLTDDEPDDEPEDEPQAMRGSDLGLEGAMAGASYDPAIEPQGDRVAPGGGRDGMAMEQSLSEMALDQGDWMQKEPEVQPESRPAEPSPTQRFRADDDEPPPEKKERPERTPRARPAPPPPPPAKSGLPALIGLVVVVALLGGGGWFGWTKFKNRKPAEPAEAAVVDPPVSIPEIPETLQPRLRELSSAAKADWIATLRTQLPAEKGLAVEPDRDWLGGSYLADASKYASIEQYWKGLDAYLTDVQARDETLFVDAVGARMDTIAAQDSASAISAADREVLSNRLRAGFQVGRAERRAVYKKLKAVVDASLGLHQFLLSNEDKITYDPAAGGASRDPVLEAVPDTPALGKEMWALVDKITESLDGLGALDRVTTDRLLELFTEQLGAVPIR